MGNLLKKIKETKQQINNAKKLKTIPAKDIFMLLCQHFDQRVNKPEKITVNGAKNTKIVMDRSLGASVFIRTIKREPFIEFVLTDDYSKRLPQNQVLLHGVVFNALYNMYMSHFKRAFDNVLLPDLQNNKTRTFFSVYEKIPKRYRGIFYQYDTDHYVLNAPTKDMVIAYNKKNKDKLAKLLLRAKQLIPVIYRENDLNDKYDTNVLNVYNKPKSSKTFSGPAFVPESFSAHLVSDEQLNTILELRDIFTEISKITLPIATRPRQQSSAKRLYDEYMSSQRRKDIFYFANCAVNTANANQRIQLAKEQKAYDKKVRRIKSGYRKLHQDQMDYLRQQTNVNIK